MGDVIEIRGKRLFTLDEAKALLPVVKRVTGDASDKVGRLSAQFSLIEEGERKAGLEEQVRVCLKEWECKISKLGCEAKGIWLVDFDYGEGYYCWHYPETELSFYHTYAEGFRGRTPLP